MNLNQINNVNIRDLDWSATDRQTMLRNIPRSKRQKDVYLAPGLVARGVCHNDVSILDSRSIKAQLSGRGDYRSVWWNFSSGILQCFLQDGSLENSMYRFHKSHHYLTFFRLDLVLKIKLFWSKLRSKSFTFTKNTYS